MRNGAVTPQPNIAEFQPSGPAQHGNSSRFDNKPQQQATTENRRVPFTDAQDLKPFSCPICPRNFDRQYSLERHITLHKADKKYECKDCDAKYSLLANLSRHQRQVHSEQMHPYEQGNTTHNKGNDPNVHNSTTISKEIENVSYTECKDCQLSFASNSGAYRIHMYSHRSSNPVTDNDNDSFLESRIAQDNCVSDATLSHDHLFIQPFSQNIYQCTDCKERFDTWDNLVIHSSSHGIPQHATSSPSLATAHDINATNFLNRESACKSVAGKPHKCELCYKSFASEDRLAVSVFFIHQIFYRQRLYICVCRHFILCLYYILPFLETYGSTWI